MTAHTTTLTNNFTLIRHLLAYLVIVSHSYPLMGIAVREPFRLLSNDQADLGGVAVTGFFIISGYLITHSWVTSSGALSFLKKRLRRICPGFYVASIVSVLVAADPSHYARPTQMFHLVGSILLLIPPTSVNGSLWSIPWEFGCYLTIPAVAALGFLRRRNWLLAAFGVMLVLYGLKEHYPKIPFPGRILTAFTAGQLFYLYRDRIRFKAGYFAGAVSLLAVSAVASQLQLFSLFMPIFGAYALFHIAFTPIKAIEPIKGFFANCDISYGVYLYAWPVQVLIINAFGSSLGHFVLLTLGIVGSTIMGVISWVVVERRFLTHRASRVQNSHNDLIPELCQTLRSS